MIQYEKYNLERSTLVFSPHPDDETLGCGGTIIRKKQAGADVKIVFMTDGSTSHSHLMPANKLKAIRASEALAAAQKLGVEASDVIFLEVKDGTLANHQDAASKRVVEIILKYLPEEIFIPYYQDGISDHNATNTVVVSALKKSGLNATVYEYPIWFWNQWPWTDCGRESQKLLPFLQDSLRSGLRFLNDFRCSVYIGDVLDLKRTALEQHKSQMVRLINNSRWLTLGDVSKGEFLKCFFQETEVFYRYKIEV
ncbi:MAG: PIG-L family deacetylase [Symploca sp. SIO2B6]|nr:PIG-L family deacetylase [Symploca sp. SIO2B6]